MKACVGDAVIIGGGFVGLASAWLLAREGVKVVLLEQSGLGSGASGLAQGGLGPAPWSTGFDLDWQVRGLSAYLDLVGPSRPFELGQQGALFVAESETQARMLRNAAGATAKLGENAEWLDPSALRLAEPALSQHLLGGWWFKQNRNLDVGGYIRYLTERAVDAGAIVRSGIGPVCLSRAGDRVNGVVTSTDTISAGTIVVAAGVGTAALLRRIGVTVPIVPQRGVVLHMPQPLVPVRRYVIAADYSDANAHSRQAGQAHIATVLQPVSHAEVTIGASREFVGLDREVAPELVEAIVTRARRILPELERRDDKRPAAGFRPWTPDGRPLVGPVPELPDLVIAAGHNGDGLAGTLPTAQLVVGHILGQAQMPAVAELAPERFGTSAASQSQLERT